MVTYFGVELAHILTRLLWLCPLALVELGPQGVVHTRFHRWWRVLTGPRRQTGVPLLTKRLFRFRVRAPHLHHHWLVRDER